MLLRSYSYSQVLFIISAAAFDSASPNDGVTHFLELHSSPPPHPYTEEMKRFHSKWGHGHSGYIGVVTPLKRKAGQAGVLGPGIQGRCPPFIYSSDSKSCFATVAWGCINSLNLKPLPMSFWEACPHPGLKGLRTTSEFQTVSQAQGRHRERHRDPLLNPCLCLSCVPARFAVPAREQHFICTIKHENLFHS